MKQEHKNVQCWIKKTYSGKYIIEAEVDEQNKLPDAARQWYQPDVIMRNKNGGIKYIIEVASKPTQKAIVGASILADASLKALNETARLYFVICHQDGIRRIQNYQVRAKIAKQYCRNIEEIKVMSFEEFKKNVYL
jgi:hypothetical protein